jgi:hypothetical protein
MLVEIEEDNSSRWSLNEYLLVLRKEVGEVAREPGGLTTQTNDTKGPKKWSRRNSEARIAKFIGHVVESGGFGDLYAGGY